MSVVRSIDLRKQNWKLWIRETQTTLQACYDMLIAPLGALPEGARLLIAPCSPLYSIPFAALWDGHTYLIKRHEIELTPCGALMLATILATCVIERSFVGLPLPGPTPSAATLQRFHVWDVNIPSPSSV